MTEPAQPVRDRDAIAEAIRALTERDWLRLHRKAELHARIVSGMEPDDLLQEAFRRTLEGERQCPVAVEVTFFLCEVMRSIASGDYRKATRRQTPLPLAGHSDEAALAPDPPDPLPDPEQRLAETQEERGRRAEILALFEDDLAAQTIAEGILDNMRGEELRLLVGLDKTGYESKRRFILRRIQKRKGAKP